MDMNVGMYEHIRQNKQRSIAVIVFYIFLITLVFAAIGIIIDRNMGASYTFAIGDSYMRFGFAALFSIIGLLTASILSIYTFKNCSSVIARISNAVPVKKEEYPYLINTVEGLALSAAIPVPQVFIVDTQAVNAFASGTDPENSMVAVTKGLLDSLNREELEGVLAHEVAHIKNFDVRYASLIAALTGLLLFVSDMALRGFRFSSFSGSGGGGKSSDSDSKGGNSLKIVIVIIGLIILIFAPLIGYLIQCLMSRQREYLADASGASLIGYPLGLASALEKIEAVSDTQTAHDFGFKNKAINALCIINPLTNEKPDNIFNTHPATKTRVQRLKNM